MAVLHSHRRPPAPLRVTPTLTLSSLAASGALALIGNMNGGRMPWLRMPDASLGDDTRHLSAQSAQTNAGLRQTGKFMRTDTPHRIFKSLMNPCGNLLILADTPLLF